MKRKIFILTFIIFFIFTSAVFATNTDIQSVKINEDIYEFDNPTYTLDSEVSGNIFISPEKFEMADTSSVSGNLYVICKSAHFKSNVSYSNTVSKDGSNSIDTINSHSTVNGNVFIICDEFILEPGCEISGDLYIIANKIDIQKSSAVYGNLFAIGTNINLNGRIGNSVYASSENFTTSYYGSVGKDLNLVSEKAVLNSVIHRNANITSQTVTTSKDFLLYGNLDSNSHEFNFSGQIDGNAKINSKEINFIDTQDDETIKCLISGDLNYSSKDEMQIGENIVKGKINYSKYEEKLEGNKFNFKEFIIGLITFITYVLIIALICNLLSKKRKNERNTITVKNALISLGIGLLSILVAIVLPILLFMTQIGAILGFVLIFAYALLLFMAIPTLILDIALLFKDKYNLYLLTAVLALALYLISAIPVLGGLVMFVILMTGAGRIVYLTLFNK